MNNEKIGLYPPPHCALQPIRSRLYMGLALCILQISFYFILSKLLIKAPRKIRESNGAQPRNSVQVRCNLCTAAHIAPQIATKRRPMGYWATTANQRAFLDDLAKALPILNMNDWYGVSAETIHNFPGGKSFLRHFGHSPSAAIISLFPEHQWDETKFSKMSNRYWDDPAAQKRFLEECGSKIGISSLDDWYQVSTEKILQLGGVSVLSRYKGSLFKALQALYPEHKFQGWRFKTVPRGYWNEHSHRVEYVKYLMEQLLLASMDNWYLVKKADIVRLGGGGLLARFDDKLAYLLMDVFPSHDWEPWRFSRTVGGYWKSQENRAKYFDWLAMKLNVSSLEEWYVVSVQQVRQLDGAGVLQRYSDNLFEALRDAYPEHNWERWRFLPSPPT